MVSLGSLQLSQLLGRPFLPVIERPNSDAFFSAVAANVGHAKASSSFSWIFDSRYIRFMSKSFAGCWWNKISCLVLWHHMLICASFSQNNFFVMFIPEYCTLDVDRSSRWIQNIRWILLEETQVRLILKLFYLLLSRFFPLTTRIVLSTFLKLSLTGFDTVTSLHKSLHSRSAQWCLRDIKFFSVHVKNASWFVWRQAQL